MKIRSLLLGGIAVAALSLGGLAVEPAFAFGAHNPVAVDDPAVPNCTLAGAVTFENTPACETVIYTGSKSLVGSTASFRKRP